MIISTYHIGRAALKQGYKNLWKHNKAENIRIYSYIHYQLIIIIHILKVSTAADSGIDRPGGGGGVYNSYTPQLPASYVYATPENVVMQAFKWYIPKHILPKIWSFFVLGTLNELPL